MKNYIDGLIESINDKKLRFASIAILENIEKNGYVLADVNRKKEYERVTYGKFVVTESDELEFIFEMVEDENVQKHKIKVEFERNVPLISMGNTKDLEFTVYNCTIVIRDATKEYLANKEKFDEINECKNVFMIDYKPNFMSDLDKKFSEKLKTILKKIQRLESKGSPKDL